MVNSDHIEASLDLAQEDSHPMVNIAIQVKTPEVVRPQHRAHEDSTWRPIITNLLSGALAGAVAKTTIAPLDRTKILFQTSDMKFSVRQVVSVLNNVYQKEGILALWRGNSATMVRIIPYAALQYSTHEQYKKLLKPNNAQNLAPFARFCAGSMAGVTASALTYPLDLVRARMAVTERTRYRGMLSMCLHTLKHEGPKAFYQGFLPTMLGAIPYGGTSFFTYETFKKRHKEVTNNRDPTPLERLCYGAIAGLCGQTSSYPLDVIRRRMQTAGITKYSYKTIVKTAREIYQEGGIKGGLYKGLSMNWVKGPIAVGISFTVFDMSKNALSDSHLFSTGAK
ncbi:mitochondrial coenzyme A transporter SLC25A42-like [Apostichopus japonicus]